jgi:peptide chain release factor 1
MRVIGEGAEPAFRHEQGVHSWQRTAGSASRVSVTVLAEPDEAKVKLRRGELLWQSGPGGGLARAPAVIVTDPGSGLTVCCDGGSSEQQNRERALALLRARVHAGAVRKKAAAPASVRRTVSVGRGEVIDHVLRVTWPLAAYLRGDY